MSNDTYFADSWFSGAKKSKGAIYNRVDHCGMTKTRLKGSADLYYDKFY